MSDSQPAKKQHRDLSLSAIEAGLEERFALKKSEWKRILQEPHDDIKAPVPGRKTKLNEGIAKEIWGGIRIGLSLERAAQAAGIHRVTLWRWFQAAKGKDNEEPREPYASFFSACVMADAQCERECLNIITEAARGLRAEHTNKDGERYTSFRQWTAAAWILERKYRWTAPRAPWVPEPTEADQNAAAVGVPLADLVGAKKAMAVNTGAEEAPEDPDEKVRKLEAQMAEMRAELEARRAASGQVDAATPGAGPPA